MNQKFKILEKLGLNLNLTNEEIAYVITSLDAVIVFMFIMN